MKPVHATLRSQHLVSAMPCAPHRDGPFPEQLREVRNASDLRSHVHGRKRALAEPAAATEAKRRATSSEGVERSLDPLIHAYRKRRGSPLTILNAARDLLQSQRDPKKCVALYERIEDKLHTVGLYPNCLHINAVLAICKRGKDMDTAWDVYRSMPERRRPIPPDRVTFNTLIGGFGADGNASRVSNLLDRMAQLGIEPDAITLIGVMDAHAHGQDAAKTELVLRQLQRLPDASVPTRAQWGIAVKAYEIINEPRHCWRLIQDMLAEDPPIAVEPGIYGLAMRACVRTGDWETAWQLKLSMEAQHPPVPFDSFMWHALLNACKKGRNPDGAEAALRLMREPGSGVKPDLESYGVVISGFHEANRAVDAARLLVEAINAGVVGRNAGYIPRQNTMNFHRGAVANNPWIEDAEKGVPAGMAVTLVAWLFGMGKFNENTTFVVGHGDGKIRNAVLPVLLELGFHHKVDPDNQGRLIPA